jgi:polysaccharide deacetylase 2 family uncharacterized protein YibQ
LTPTLRGVNPAGRAAAALVVSAAILAGGVIGILAWLELSGPVPPVPVEVPLPVAALQVAKPMVALAPAPDPELIERRDDRLLPIVGRDGRKPWQVYARPFDGADPRPRLAIVIDGLGASATDTDLAIRLLPPAVTLSFTPYRKRLAEWVTLARAAGHEVLLDLPMDSAEAPPADLLPFMLRSGVDPNINLMRLDGMLGEATGYVGMIAMLGGRFAATRADLAPMLQELQRRGLLYIDDGAAAPSAAAAVAGELRLPFVAAEGSFDGDPTPGGIDRRLAALEDAARRGGPALAVGQVSPVLMERIVTWTPLLADRGLVLAPVSALINPALAAGAPAVAAAPPKG